MKRRRISDAGPTGEYEGEGRLDDLPMDVDQDMGYRMGGDFADYRECSLIARSYMYSGMKQKIPRTILISILVCGRLRFANY